MTTEYFTLKEDGVIGWIENMPPKPREQYPQLCTMAEITEYQQALQSAISNAIEVSNPEEVKVHIFRTNPGLQYILENTPYPLQCHVEKKVIETKEIVLDLEFTGGKTVALVTFSEPEIRTVLCTHGHPDGLTKGKVYNVVGESDKFFDIKPDDFGHLSGFDKRYFSEPSAGVEETQVTELARWLNHYFNSLRHNTNHHLGLGDVRLTVSMQEEIVEYIRKYESKTHNP